LSDFSNTKADYKDLFGETEMNAESSNHIFAHKALKLQQYLLQIGIKYKF
jgi:hypothetical protein